MYAITASSQSLPNYLPKAFPYPMESVPGLADMCFGQQLLKVPASIVFVLPIVVTLQALFGIVLFSVFCFLGIY